MIQIEPASPDPSRPYLNLQPVVDFLLRSGNTLAQRNVWANTKSGWTCVFAERLDLDAVKAAISFPPTIELSPKSDAIFDPPAYTSIYGGAALARWRQLDEIAARDVSGPLSIQQLADAVIDYAESQQASPDRGYHLRLSSIQAVRLPVEGWTTVTINDVPREVPFYRGYPVVGSRMTPKMIALEASLGSPTYYGDVRRGTVSTQPIDSRND